MDKLPAEILHLICKRLSRRDVRVLRLVNRTLSQVAAFYLIDTVHFHTSDASFERLRLLSTHPVFQQTIVEVIYEASTIEDQGSKDAYFARYKHVSPYAPIGGTLSEREKRLHKRNARKRFQEGLSDHYEQYLHHFEQQQRLLNPSQLDISIGSAISRFVNLRRIAFSPLSKCHHGTSRRFLAEYRAGCSIPMTMNPGTTSLQVQPLLLPGGRIKPTLRSIHIESLSPSFFSQPAIQEVMKEAFAKLTHIRLSLRVFHHDICSSDVDITAACRRLLKSGVLKDSLAAAQELKSLSISIYASPPMLFDVSEYIFGKTIWPDLRTLELESFKVTHESFMNLLQRHAKLIDLTMTDIGVGEGSWIPILDEMRNNSKLENFIVCGYLQDGNDVYDIHLLDADAYMSGCRFSLGHAIQCYVCFDKELVEENPLIDFHLVFEDPEILYDELGTINDGLLGDSFEFDWDGLDIDHGDGIFDSLHSLVSDADDSDSSSMSL